MKSHSVWVAGTPFVFALTLAGCVTNAPSLNSGNGLPTAQENAELPSYRIRSWSAPNDRTLIVESYDGTRYQAEMLGPCLGLGFSNRLGFVNRGGFQQVDRFSGVVLADGTRCTFQSFNKLVTPEGSALDRFEKLASEPESGSAESPH